MLARESIATANIHRNAVAARPHQFDIDVERQRCISRQGVSFVAALRTLRNQAQRPPPWSHGRYQLYSCFAYKRSGAKSNHVFLCHADAKRSLQFLRPSRPVWATYQLAEKSK